MIGRMAMEKKTICITGKRQITIPQSYFQIVGFDREAECILRDGEIVLRPVSNGSGNEFAEQVLADLIHQGYSGEELLKRFKEQQKKVRPAIEKMIEESVKAASGKGESVSSEDIFE